MDNVDIELQTNENYDDKYTEGPGKNGSVAEMEQTNSGNHGTNALPKEDVSMDDVQSQASTVKDDVSMDGVHSQVSVVREDVSMDGMQSQASDTLPDAPPLDTDQDIPDAPPLDGKGTGMLSTAEGNEESDFGEDTEVDDDTESNAAAPTTTAVSRVDVRSINLTFHLAPGSTLIVDPGAVVGPVASNHSNHPDGPSSQHSVISVRSSDFPQSPHPSTQPDISLPDASQESTSSVTPGSSQETIVSVDAEDANFALSQPNDTESQLVRLQPTQSEIVLAVWVESQFTSPVCSQDQAFMFSQGPPLEAPRLMYESGMNAAEPALFTFGPSLAVVNTAMASTQPVEQQAASSDQAVTEPLVLSQIVDTIQGNPDPALDAPGKHPHSQLNLSLR